MRLGNHYDDAPIGIETDVNEEFLDRTIREYSVAPWTFVPTCMYCGKAVLGIKNNGPGVTYCCADCAGLAKPGPEAGYPLAE